MSRRTVLCERFLADESAATMVEYGLLMALVALVVIGAVTTLGTNLNGMMNQAGNTI